MSGRKISLKFAEEVDGITRARMTYAFRVFAAVHSYEVISEPNTNQFSCVYGGPGDAACANHSLSISARYRRRDFQEPPTKPAFHEYAGEKIPLFYGLDGQGEPDWLGEIFEWISGSLEMSCEERDRVGRIPFSETVFGQERMSPLKPYAGILMHWLQSALRGRSRTEDFGKAVSPIRNEDHAVICSHDIDFHHSKSSSTWRRIGKNLVYSVVGYSSPSFLWANLRMSGSLLRGKPVGAYIPWMVEAIEAQGFRSTLFVVADNNHRRDPEYQLEEIAPELRLAAQRGFEIGLHGSYESIARSWTLEKETKKLGDIVGQRPSGSRQHWLRFHTQERLYRELQRAGLAYDSSVGFAEMCGFRNGASFAYPPYDFELERPYDFLEIPLVIMDGSLVEASRTLRRKPQEIADEILNESRKWGWGGISVLWHNPMEALQVPEEINRVFWKLAEGNGKNGERWMSAKEFVRKSLGRYQAAGLLEKVKFDA